MCTRAETDAGGARGPGGCGFRLRHPRLGGLCPIAGPVEFENDAVVGDPIDGRRRGHGVLEYPVSLGEHQVRRDDHALPFIGLGLRVKRRPSSFPILRIKERRAQAGTMP